MTFYDFVMKILRRFHLKYALGTSNYLLLGRGGGSGGCYWEDGFHIHFTDFTPLPLKTM